MVNDEPGIGQEFEVLEGQVMLRGDPDLIARLWACYHAVVGIPTRPLQDGVLTVLFAALVEVLTTGKFDGDVFVCRSAVIRRVAQAALALWPTSIDLRAAERAAPPERVPVGGGMGRGPSSVRQSEPDGQHPGAGAWRRRAG